MPPPRIIEHPMDIRRPVTVSTVFVCVGQGYGSVDVNWVRIIKIDERPLRSKSTVTTMVTPDNITSILTIPDLEERDGRGYRCIYNNSAGEAHSNKATLTIGSKC